MDTKHTPGPWRVGKQWSVVADSEIGTHSDQQNREYYGGALVCESVRTEANARLIAAAPELLEALKEAVCALEVCGKDFRATEVARAAITKATTGAE
jgi:hypothetical protein